MSKIVTLQAIIPIKYDMLKMVSSIYMQYTMNVYMASRWRQKGVACGKMNKIWVSQHVPMTSPDLNTFICAMFLRPSHEEHQASRHPRKKNRPLALQDMPGLTTGPITRHLHANVMGLEHLGRIPFNKIDY